MDYVWSHDKPLNFHRLSEEQQGINFVLELIIFSKLGNKS